MSPDNMLKRYLLGTLGEEEQRPIEELLISDRGFFEQAMIAEDELIDEYLDDRLSESEKERFVKHFLATPQQRQKLKVAQAIKRFIDRSESIELAAPVGYGKKLYFWWRRAVAASL